MNENPKVNLKEAMRYAKGQLIGRYGMAMWIATLPILVETLITTFTTNTATSGVLIISVLISIVVNLLIGVLILGQSKVFLYIARGDKSHNMSDVVTGLKENVDKAILAQLPFTLVSVICIIPSIMYNLGFLKIPDNKLSVFELIINLVQIVLVFLAKTFFGMNFYLLSDHPEYDIATVYKESITMLSGNRLRYVLLYIINIPLMIVSCMACFIGVFWFMAYIDTVFANFYLLLKGEKPWSIEDEFKINYDNINNDENNSF